MSIIEIILIGIGLSMDAFAVSICKGLSLKSINIKNSIIVGLYFGIFQGLMPILGYLLGINFESFITSIDHYIVFILLLILGINMIKDSLNTNEELNDKLDFKTMLVLSVATSIDALAVGISFAFLQVNIIISSLIITMITFIFCSIGVIVGNKVGNKCGSKAMMLGGIILILIGIKILIEHLFF